MPTLLIAPHTMPFKNKRKLIQLMQRNAAVQRHLEDARGVEGCDSEAEVTKSKGSTKSAPSNEWRQHESEGEDTNSPRAADGSAGSATSLPATGPTTPASSPDHYWDIWEVIVGHACTALSSALALRGKCKALTE